MYKEQLQEQVHKNVMLIDENKALEIEVKNMKEKVEQVEKERKLLRDEIQVTQDLALKKVYSIKSKCQAKIDKIEKEYKEAMKKLETKLKTEKEEAATRFRLQIEMAEQQMDIEKRQFKEIEKRNSEMNETL